MDVFKTSPGVNESILITEENYKNATKAKADYYVQNNAKGKKYYAVCPLCDNPIQIIGLYKKHQDGRKPYGKHHKGDLECIAKYDEDAYLSCPYSMPNKPKKAIKRMPEAKSSLELLKILKTQFDRIVYIWNKTTGIKMSESFAKELLGNYIDDDGYLYYDSNKHNLPYMLIYARHRYSLVGRNIYKGSLLHEGLKNFKSIKLMPVSYNDNLVKIIPRNNEYIDIAFYLTKHRTPTPEHPKETYELVVVENEKIKLKIPVTVDFDMLPRLMDIPEEKAHRDKRFLKIAEELM